MSSLDPYGFMGPIVYSWLFFDRRALESRSVVHVESQRAYTAGKGLCASPSLQLSPLPMKWVYLTGTLEYRGALCAMLEMPQMHWSSSPHRVKLSTVRTLTYSIEMV